MINFFKKLLGFKTEGACPSTPKETVQEILTPPAPAYVAPAKPANKKVKAISAPVKQKVAKQQPKQAVKVAPKKSKRK